VKDHLLFLLFTKTAAPGRCSPAIAPPPTPSRCPDGDKTNIIKTKNDERALPAKNKYHVTDETKLPVAFTKNEIYY